MTTHLDWLSLLMTSQLVITLNQVKNDPGQNGSEVGPRYSVNIALDEVQLCSNFGHSEIFFKYKKKSRARPNKYRVSNTRHTRIRDTANF